VPVAVVAGVVLFVEGLIVGQLRPEATEDGAGIVGDLATVSYGLGGLSLLAGWVAFLLARASLAPALEALVLSASTVALYAVGWITLLGALTGGAADLFFVKPLGVTGKGAALLAIGGLLACVGLFALCFRLTARVVWPFFRAAVALNVLAMLHLVVLLLGTVSYLNLHFTARLLGSGVDLTETGEFTLSDKTRAVLDHVDGELQVIVVDYAALRRERAPILGKVQELLLQFQTACPKLKLRTFDAARSGDELQKVLQENGMEGLLEGATGDEDLVLLGYRPPGDRVAARTRSVRLSQEFADTSALGNSRFRGEGILTNAISEVVFTQRKVLFLEGHGEKSIGGTGGATQSLALVAEALRADNCGVSSQNLAQSPEIPAGVDLVVIAGPLMPLGPPEAEALRNYLGRGGSVAVFLDPVEGPAPKCGLEGIFESYGVEPRRDALVISYLVEKTRLAGDIARAVNSVMTTNQEFGRHPSMEALKKSSFVVSFWNVCPVFKAEKPPEGVTVDELVVAPREVGEQGLKPFGAIRTKGRQQYQQPIPGMDIIDKRLPIVVVAEKKSGETGKGGGRLLVFGDSDFATDIFLGPGTQTQANRNLVLNVFSWAVRRDLIAIDPKSLETEVVAIRPLDRDLAFWASVVALPVLALGLAVGVWWGRRR
jgi:hypothetical protein